jgi:hypothetical protein
VLAAASRVGSGIPAGQAAKLRAGEEYARRAITAVRVVRDLRLEVPDTTVRSTDQGRAAGAALAERWGLGGSMDRVLAALAGERG